MKTEKELNADILKITMLIQDKFPELSKYIAEMPVTIPNEATPEITIKILKDYYESLAILLKDYDANHSSNLK
ncbi:hypothetical protein [Emticicia sp. SJ17W-69]|uniref:hypothetical protein n=1 Tax=Emticicia sp. SJ17W-69 TaxID=3421657 RepID=UPI003EBBB779